MFSLDVLDRGDDLGVRLANDLEQGRVALLQRLRVLGEADEDGAYARGQGAVSESMANLEAHHERLRWDVSARAHFSSGR